MTKHPDAQLAAIREDVRQRARDLGRVFRRSDLVAWGQPSDLVVPMLRRGWWERLHHGVYTDVRDIDGDAESRSTHLLHLAASIRALAEPAYAFAGSAALLHGLALPRGLADHVHLVRPLGAEGRSLSRRITGRRRVTPPAMTTYQLGPDDLTVVEGIPTVCAPLAAVSAAVGCTPDWAVAVLDSVAWQKNDCIDDMRSHASRLQHLAGIGPVRAACDLVRSGAQTPLETHSRLRLVRCGLPEPRLQVPFFDEDGLIGYVDMYFDSLGVIGEADGLIKYATGADLIAEKRREDRLRRLHPVVRWDWDRIWSDPRGVARQIRDAATWRRAG